MNMREELLELGYTLSSPYYNGVKEKCFYLLRDSYGRIVMNLLEERKYYNTDHLTLAEYFKIKAITNK